MHIIFEPAVERTNERSNEICIPSSIFSWEHRNEKQIQQDNNIFKSIQIAKCAGFYDGIGLAHRPDDY